MNERWISTGDAARYLGVHPSTVRELIDEGKLVARVYRYGQRPTIRIDIAELDRFIARWTDPDASTPGSPQP